MGPEDLNGPKSGIVGQGITIPDWWGHLGAILGHFGVILGPRARGWGLFGAYFSSIWLLKMTWIAPNLVQWDKGITILDWWGPYGAFLGHYGVYFRVILGPGARGWGLFWAYLSCVWLLKMTCMAPNLVKWDKGNTRPDWWGPLGAILGPFRVQFGVILASRARDWGLYGACFEPISHLFGCSKWLEWPQIW